MRLREIKLVSEVETLDAMNQPTTTKTPGETLVVEFRSVSSSEFFSARQGGLLPEFSFIISTFDYHGEKEVEYNGNRYAVYRTYKPDDDTVEVYCQTESGVSYVESGD